MGGHCLVDGGGRQPGARGSVGLVDGLLEPRVEALLSARLELCVAQRCTLLHCTPTFNCSGLTGLTAWAVGCTHPDGGQLASSAARVHLRTAQRMSAEAGLEALVISAESALKVGQLRVQRAGSGRKSWAACMHACMRTHAHVHACVCACRVPPRSPPTSPQSPL